MLILLKCECPSQNRQSSLIWLKKEQYKIEHFETQADETNPRNSRLRILG